MNLSKLPLGVLAVLLALAVGGCAGQADPPEDMGADVSAAGDRDPAAGEAGEATAPSEADGEESGTELALDATYDELRGGARLILAYDAERSAFSGTVENVTEEPLARVRVEVHLSNGTELGPTPAADLAPGESTEVTLSASGEFDAWSAHAEVGNEEHGGEADGEHDEGEEEGGEHDREGRGEPARPGA
ncbi:MAG: FxLYD domain-containing protein [Vicinamibacterales bacterium]|jgi:hypothetical protein|nr:hypothetical protein [Acidobacteriota bacterium]MDP6373477.1 FxLYD domain-containing protein [Vicinamibacterales bacterium]MDP6610381.1 FxLYD domain-containing protein [Vicinamibacterales bacterium]MQG57484.1 hypothetical protein [SAR202 cluster bacterium]HAK54787.1 hypothetical protein [Acidobacteriota bacterium]